MWTGGLSGAGEHPKSRELKWKGSQFMSWKTGKNKGRTLMDSLFFCYSLKNMLDPTWTWDYIRTIKMLNAATLRYHALHLSTSSKETVMSEYSIRNKIIQAEHCNWMRHGGNSSILLCVMQGLCMNASSLNKKNWTKKWSKGVDVTSAPFWASEESFGQLLKLKSCHPLLQDLKEDSLLGQGSKQVTAACWHASLGESMPYSFPDHCRFLCLHLL